MENSPGKFFSYLSASVVQSTHSYSNLLTNPKQFCTDVMVGLSDSLVNHTAVTAMKTFLIFAPIAITLICNLQCCRLNQRSKKPMQEAVELQRQKEESQ